MGFSKLEALHPLHPIIPQTPIARPSLLLAQVSYGFYRVYRVYKVYSFISFKGSLGFIGFIGLNSGFLGLYSLLRSGFLKRPAQGPCSWFIVPKGLGLWALGFEGCAVSRLLDPKPYTLNPKP